MTLNCKNACKIIALCGVTHGMSLAGLFFGCRRERMQGQAISYSMHKLLHNTRDYNRVWIEKRTGLLSRALHAEKIYWTPSALESNAHFNCATQHQIIHMCDII